jgi:3'-phosphoadenosine 5'-phosphosulfate sulfotransferase (PAPS reductase)/FAD synthetase
MQITVNNDFSNGPRPFTQQEIDSFLQDEQIAVNILNSTQLQRCGCFRAGRPE